MLSTGPLKLLIRSISSAGSDAAESSSSRLFGLKRLWGRTSPRSCEKCVVWAMWVMSLLSTPQAPKLRQVSCGPRRSRKSSKPRHRGDDRPLNRSSPLCRGTSRSPLMALPYTEIACTDSRPAAASASAPSSGAFSGLALLHRHRPLPRCNADRHGPAGEHAEGLLRPLLQGFVGHGEGFVALRRGRPPIKQGADGLPNSCWSRWPAGCGVCRVASEGAAKG